MMDRRRFLVTSLAGSLAVPLGVGAQQMAKIYRVGVLFPQDPTIPILSTFFGGMKGRGGVENQNFVVLPRYAEGKLERLPDLAAELVRLNIDVLVTMGTPATLAAKQATTTIPIVCLAW